MTDLKLKYDTVLFDLDGTLSESALGVKHSLEYALEQVGAKNIDLSDFSIYIGPPLMQTLRNHCGLSGERMQAAFDIYIKRYSEKGKYENRLYDGIRELISDLKAAGARVAVCSSKCEKFAGEVTDILGITDLFDAVCGSTLDGERKEKEDLIPYALGRLGVNADSRAVMIGDTYYDAKGAEKTSVDFIGVLYGYGKKDTMQEYSADKFAHTVADLRQHLFL